MRKTVVAVGALASLAIASPAFPSECPGNPGALGTSRTIVVDPSQHSLLGSFQYRETLPLADKEVVITFDDGPLPPYSTRILDILARECVKATFFLVGKMARSFPRIVQRVYEDGHTLANHSESHPFNFHSMSALDAAREIDGGFASIAAAVGDPAKVAPFFRFPGLHRQDAVERSLASRGMMAWSVDFMADDWTRISSHEIIRRALARLEAKGKGILLLHDIKPATALALPELLHELKVRGYRIVHVVPAAAGRTATATSPDQWLARHPPSQDQLAHRGPSVWPRVLPRATRALPVATRAPSISSFGAGPDGAIPVALTSDDGARMGAGLDGGMGEAEAPPPEWPEPIMIAALPAVDILPAPGADNFRFVRIGRDKRKDRRRPAARHATAAHSNDVTGSVPTHRDAKAAPKPARPKSPERPKALIPLPANGHQLQITRPRV